MDSNMDNSQNSWNTSDQGMSSGGDYGGYQNNGYGNTSYQDGGYQAGGFQNRGYQGDGYQSGYQNNGYQAGYQNNGYQNSGYQGGGYQGGGYQGGYGGYNPNAANNPYISNDNSSQTVSVGEWIVTFILMIIPIVNIIMLLVWAFSSGTTLSKKNWAKAELILILISIVLGVIFSIAFGATFYEMLNQMQRSGYRY